MTGKSAHPTTLNALSGGGPYHELQNTEQTNSELNARPIKFQLKVAFSSRSVMATEQINTDVKVKDPFDINLDCIHCGFCVPRCPTYQVLGDENDSPRGRIYLMKALQGGAYSSRRDLHRASGLLPRLPSL